MLIAFIFFLASLLQGTVGFGMGLLAMPLIIWAGLSLSESVLLVSLISFLQSGYASFQLREHIPWKEALWAGGLRVLTIPLGVLLLTTMNQWAVDELQRILGGVILLAVLSRWLFKIPARDNIPWPWSLFAFSLSGVMAGSLGIGGPPIVLWATALNWSAMRIRSFLLSTFAITLAFQIAYLWWRFPAEGVPALKKTLLCLPAIFLGTWLGLLIGKRFSAERLKLSAYLVLLVIALVSLV